MKAIGLVILLLSSGTGLFFSCKAKTVNKQGANVKELNYIPYYLKVYEADSLYITKNYQRSYEILDSLFQKYESLNMVNYYEVNRYYQMKILLKKKIKVEDFSKLISEYGLAKETLKKDSIFQIYYLKEKAFFDANYDGLKGKYLSSLNIDLRNEIREMSKQDQMYRNKDYRTNISKQNRIDSINSRKLVKIFNDFGYPNERVIGGFSIDSAFVDLTGLLLHTKDAERVDYFMPKILGFIKEGKARPIEYAYMKDQFHLYHGEDQYYGSYSNETKIPLGDLNRRRKSIGLPNYGYEKWRLRQLYPNEEY